MNQVINHNIVHFMLYFDSLLLIWTSFVRGGVGGIVFVAHFLFLFASYKESNYASYEVISCSTDIHILTKMAMTSDGTQIQILANWLNCI